jgi:malate dehydrogenase (oxaloacetate-decarboxylating)(NADP+)
MPERRDALDYHSQNRPGKIEVVPSKPCETALDLSLAYTPGVAQPTLAIKERPDDAYLYTAKGNLVGVVTNGTAVLGLGDIGPLAAKPVMEGKGILFKKFADIDVFDIEINEKDPKRLVEIIASLAPTFGGINLEDIKAPECFYVEQELAKILPIPVFHDDQHGTAIITGAALLNALEIVGKNIKKIKVAVSGAGAAALASIRFYISLGVSPENIVVADKGGVLYEGRTEGIDETHRPYLRATKKRTLADLFEGADVFLGLSAGNIVTQDMVKKMAKNPIIFALANPVPEISYPDAVEARPDAIVATGRSDFPNQVNNVLGFPFIFRGALDTRSRCINEEMKLAASHAIASLAKQEIPDSVKLAYGNIHFSFGREYIIPKPFDPRVLGWVAPAVAEAATKSGAARRPMTNIKAYRDELEKRLNPARGALNLVYEKARSKKMRVVFSEGDNKRVLQAARTVLEEGIAEPILLGNVDFIHRQMESLKLNLPNVQILDPIVAPDAIELAKLFFEMRQRRGVTMVEARHLLRSRTYYAAMMVREGIADGMVAGVTRPYPNAVRPILECIGSPERTRAMAMYMMAFKEDVKFLCDTTLNIDPSAEELAQIAMNTADRVHGDFGIIPRIAMLSFSNFGSTDHPSARKVAKATEIVKMLRPDLEIDGEMQADVALDEDKRREHFPFSTLQSTANILIFSNLESANIAYKLLGNLAQCEAVGPILIGLKAAANVCQLHSSVKDIVHMCAITAAHAQDLKQNKKK